MKKHRKKLIYGLIVFCSIVLMAGTFAHATEYSFNRLQNEETSIDNLTLIGSDAEMMTTAQQSSQNLIRSAYSYNELNQLESIVQSDGNRLTYSYDQNGNQLGSVTDTAPSVTKTESETSNYNVFPSTLEYLTNDYIGTLTAVSAPIVISGYYSPSDTKVISSYCRIYIYAHYNSNGQMTMTDYSGNCPYEMPYSTADGYFGVLTLQSTVANNYCPVTGPPHSVCTQMMERFYSGYVTRPEIDTRIWRQDYSGVVYQIN